MICKFITISMAENAKFQYDEFVKKSSTKKREKFLELIRGKSVLMNFLGRMLGLVLKRH